MAYLKIPLSLSAAVGNHITLTAPQPPLSADEWEKDISPSERLYRRTLQLIPPLAKYAVWICSLCEVAVILAAQHPAHPLAQKTLRTLVWGSAQSAQRIGRITPAYAVGCALAVAGGALRRECFRALGRFFTFELALRPKHRLVTGGPYAIVRHPAYTTGIAGITGIAVCLGSPGSWLRESGVLTTLWGGAVAGAWYAWSTYLLGSLFWRMPQEDRMLRRQFGQEWDEWAARVPYRLVPGVY
ncbi:hypothetical protein OBBRIDRAFT_794398 [Obba rivulosa]|uniref:Protein-S-isoprenylcysteine O-methyltransferase n=1 Tax=Obba rivulosa TaxID=1052685 RepID=A0A8E2B162_9APHY|nr:hypothetical protein OBBRIDRAFT_794398 [Obba rivulosa]